MYRGELYIIITFTLSPICLSPSFSVLIKSAVFPNILVKIALLPSFLPSKETSKIPLLLVYSHAQNSVLEPLFLNVDLSVASTICRGFF